LIKRRDKRRIIGLKEAEKISRDIIPEKFITISLRDL